MVSTQVEQLRRDPMIRFRQLQTSCNARRPINKLPIEILTQIFANALAEDVDNPYLLQDLSQVCSQWRSIIADAPLLYRSFRLQNPTLTALHLERSRGLALDVDIHDIKCDVSETVALMNSISILGLQLDRVRSLGVTSHSYKMSAWVLGMLEDFPHRRLTSLSLALTRQEKPVSLRLPDLEEAEQTLSGLTSLSLCNLNIGRGLFESAEQRKISTFNLRRLELEYTVATPPTNATLIHLLSRCSELEEFTLRSVEPVAFERKNEDGDGLPMCQLSKLKTFTYHAPNFKALADIIRHIEPDASQTPNFDLSFPMDDQVVTTLLFRQRDNGKRVYKLACMGQSLRRMDVRSSGQQMQILGFYEQERATLDLDVNRQLEDRLRIGRPHGDAFGTKPILLVVADQGRFQRRGSFLESVRRLRRSRRPGALGQPAPSAALSLDPGGGRGVVDRRLSAVYGAGLHPSAQLGLVPQADYGGTPLYHRIQQTSCFRRPVHPHRRVKVIRSLQYLGDSHPEQGVSTAPRGSTKRRIRDYLVAVTTCL